MLTHVQPVGGGWDSKTPDDRCTARASGAHSPSSCMWAAHEDAKDRRGAPWEREVLQPGIVNEYEGWGMMFNLDMMASCAKVDRHSCSENPTELVVDPYPTSKINIFYVLFFHRKDPESRH